MTIDGWPCHTSLTVHPHRPHLLLVQRLMAAISAADQAQAARQAIEAKAEAEAAQVKVLLACLDGGDRRR